ncbi:MAG: MATE family efflux transporter [Acutalibacter sp.]|nr:MATE family efflux transporter [Acutalibacter sp.]
MEEKMFNTERLVPTYLKQSLPVVFSMMVSLVYNLADTYFIARSGNALLVAGVSVCAPVFTVLMAFGNVYAQGGSSLIARLLGKNDRDSVRRISSFSFYLAIATGLALTVLMLAFQRPILTLMGASADTMAYAQEYYVVLAAGAPLVVLSFIHSNLLRCEGFSTLSMVGTVAGSVVNIILDPIFISVLGWGAAGAAAATLIGYLFSIGMFLAVVLRRSKSLSVDPRRLRVSGRELGQILSVGLTAAVTNLGSSVSVMVMNQFLLPYGDDRIATLGIVLKVNMIAQMLLIGLSFGGVPLFGYLYGARDFARLKKLLRFCTLFLCGLALVMTVFLFAAAPWLIRIFLNDPGIVESGAIMLRWQAAGAVCAGIVLLFTCLFQATGKAAPALMLSLSRQGLVFLVVLAGAAAIAGYNGFLVAQPVADLLSAGLALGLYRAAFRKEEQVG